MDQAALLKKLDEFGLETKTQEHEPLHTVEQSAKIHAQIEGAHSKNLFLKDKKSRYFLVTACHDTQIDLKKLHKIIGAQGRLSFGSADKLNEFLGVQPGSVTPFAIANDTDKKVTMVLDEALFRYDIGNYHPMINTATTTIKQSDLLRFIESTDHEAHILDVSETNPALKEDA